MQCNEKWSTSEWHLRNLTIVYFLVLKRKSSGESRQILKYRSHRSVDTVGKISYPLIPSYQYSAVLSPVNSLFWTSGGALGCPTTTCTFVFPSPRSQGGRDIRYTWGLLTGLTRADRGSCFTVKSCHEPFWFWINITKLHLILLLNTWDLYKLTLSNLFSAWEEIAIWNRTLECYS